MVQVITPTRQKPPSFLQSVMGGLAEGTQQAVQQHQQQQMLREKQQAEIQKSMQIEQLKGQNKLQLQSEKLAGEKPEKQRELEVEGRDYDVIKDSFGQKFANLWRAAPVGGKTQLLETAIDATSRGHNLEELLKNVNVPETPETSQNLEEKPKQMKEGNIPPDFKWPSFDKRPVGYTPKEWNDERKTWRKENSDIFLENKTRLNNIKRDELGIKKLTKLDESKKLPEGFERFLINPETGDFYGLAQLSGVVSPEAQEWVKEIARFQNRAKDAFGSRVTNFDLMTYMKQFPGLMNTSEGRKRILGMMTINNKMDNLYADAIQKVYQKYGLNGIPQEEADRLATSMIEDETEQLRNEFLGLDEQNQMEGDQGQKKLSGKMVDVVGPDGETYEVDQSEVGELPEGFRML